MDWQDGYSTSNPEESSKGGIETHMDNVIKSYRNIWIGYKNRLLQVLTILEELKKQTSITVDKGDSFIRFKSTSNYSSFNSLFFVYEIGTVFPTLMWRHLIGSEGSYSYILLNRSVSFLPAFSFSLDQQVTLLYWGEQIPYLSVERLRNFKLTNFILKSNNPSSVAISASNICWPKSAYQFSKSQELERLATSYLFNSFMPPILDNVSEVWFESPFILIGDKKVRFLTIHKTLCSINKKTLRSIPGREVVNAKAFVIDRNFNLRHIFVDVPEESIEHLVSEESLYEVVFVKDMRLKQDPESSEHRPYIRYMVYPFESIKVFGSECYGSLLSVASIVLRERYLKSSDPFYFTISPDEFKKHIAKILNQFPYIRANELGLKLVQSRNGLNTLLSLLEVYDSDGQSFLYLHPALLECLLYNLDVTVSKNNLLRLQRIVHRYYRDTDSLTPLQNVFLIQNLFEKEFGFVPNHSEAKKLAQSLYNVSKLCIPLSKLSCASLSSR